MAAVLLFVFWLFGGGILVTHLLGYDTQTMLSNAIPKCDSTTATDLAKQALENAPLANVVKVTVYQIQGAQEVSYDVRRGELSDLIQVANNISTTEAIAAYSEVGGDK